MEKIPVLKKETSRVVERGSHRDSVSFIDNRPNKLIIQLVGEPLTDTQIRRLKAAYDNPPKGTSKESNLYSALALIRHVALTTPAPATTMRKTLEADVDVINNKDMAIVDYIRAGNDIGAILRHPPVPAPVPTQTLVFDPYDSSTWRKNEMKVTPGVDLSQLSAEDQATVEALRICALGGNTRGGSGVGPVLMQRMHAHLADRGSGIAFFYFKELDESVTPHLMDICINNRGGANSPNAYNWSTGGKADFSPPNVPDPKPDPNILSTK